MGEHQTEGSDRSALVHQSTGDILRSELEGTGEQNKRPYDVLIPLADDGFLDQHQTRRALDAIAQRLLDTLEGDDG